MPMPMQLLVGKPPWSQHGAHHSLGDRLGGGRGVTVAVQMYHSVESSSTARLTELDSTALGINADTSGLRAWRGRQSGTEEEQMHPPLESPFVARLSWVESSSFGAADRLRRRVAPPSVAALGWLVTAEAQTYILVELPVTVRLMLDESVFVWDGAVTLLPWFAEPLGVDAQFERAGRPGCRNDDSCYLRCPTSRRIGGGAVTQALLAPITRLMTRRPTTCMRTISTSLPIRVPANLCMRGTTMR